MPKDGDSIKVYCAHFDREITHVYEVHGWTYDGIITKKQDGDV